CLGWTTECYSILSLHSSGAHPVLHSFPTRRSSDLRAGRPVRLAKFPWAASGRAATLGRSDGLTKLIVDPDAEHASGVRIHDELRSEEHTSELQSRGHLVCRLLLEKKNKQLRVHIRV